MKKLFFLIICSVIFTGCNSLDQEIVDYNQQEIVVEEPIYYERELGYLEDSLRSEVLNLRSLWKVFDQTRQTDRDPTHDFKNSKYLLALKNFLSKRESVALSANELGYLLTQADYSGIDKTIRIDGRELHVRVISYNVDFYEQVMTDIPDIQNKWIFVQCWNEEEFYFKTLSDGDIQYFHDFIPMEINNMLYILMSGYALPYYPHPPFIWAWRLEDENFNPAPIFDNTPYENEDYILYNHAVFDTFSYHTKWMLYTDGSYLFAEKGKKDTEGQIRLMHIQCTVDEENKDILFISTDLQGKETVIRLVLVNDQFKIAYDK